MNEFAILQQLVVSCLYLFLHKINKTQLPVVTSQLSFCVQVFHLLKFLLHQVCSSRRTLFYVSCVK
jgi:hypothetical protein